MCGTYSQMVKKVTTKLKGKNASKKIRISYMGVLHSSFLYKYQIISK